MIVPGASEVLPSVALHRRTLHPGGGEPDRRVGGLHQDGALSGPDRLPEILRVIYGDDAAGAGRSAAAGRPTVTDGAAVDRGGDRAAAGVAGSVGGSSRAAGTRRVDPARKWVGGAGTDGDQRHARLGRVRLNLDG